MKPGKAIEEGKNRAFSLRQRIVAAATATVAIVVFTLFYSRTGHIPILQYATVPVFNQYQVLHLPSTENLRRNDRMAMSIRSGTVDFIVFYKASSNRQYPRYAGSRITDDVAVGHILLTSYADRIELTGTNKAYEIRDGQVLEYPLRMKVSPETYLRFVSEISANPSIAGMVARARSRRTRGR